MNDATPRPQRAPLVAVALAVLVGLVAGTWQLADLARDTPARVAAPAAGESVPRAASDANARWEELDASAPAASRARPDGIERSYRAGAAYYARWQAALARLRDRQYGTEIGALMRLPIDEAWRALEARLAAGDRLAASALGDLPCVDAESVSRFRAFAGALAKDLEPRAAAFVRGALDREAQTIARNAELCAARGLGDARLGALGRAQLAVTGADAPPDRLGAIERDHPGSVSNPETRARVADRDAFDTAYPRADSASTDPTGFERLLADVMSGTEAPGADDWITLLAAAELDPAVALVLGTCVAVPGHCDGFPELDADTARGVLERGAQSGNSMALDALIRSDEASGALVDAYAWALYLRWLAASGCDARSLVIEFAEASRRITELEARLDAAQRVQGAARANALIALHGAQMRAVFECPP